MKSRIPTRSDRKARQLLGRDAWLEAARDALIEEGTAGVEINKLAKRLGVTRGGFYRFIETREQLLAELLALREIGAVRVRCGSHSWPLKASLIPLWVP